MDHYSEASIIANDLDSMVYRIKALPPHPRYADALNLVTQAKEAILAGRIEMHLRAIGERLERQTVITRQPLCGGAAETYLGIVEAPIAHHPV